MTSQLEFGYLFEIHSVEIQSVEVKTDSHYYNTTGLTGRILKDRQLRADSMTQKILDFFRDHPGKSYTAHAVRRKLNFNPFQITSARRAITNLTDDGRIRMTGEKVIECQGEPNNKWTVI